MDAIWAVLVSLSPMLAMLPLALAAVAIVALLVVPPLRHALGAWAVRRFGISGASPAEGDEVRRLRAAVSAAEQRAVEAQASVAALERRLDAGALPVPDHIREIEEER